ncbi:unnamed protein product [Miscanthus lutarioriparius]|uniref:Uncharacterized protein n=1 Tax=Miscanthus lutarioriparius TaxID=422564 RepID=A0A811Q9Q0_9POAL|nr:unnamed protein product [Miscanthus lutarioriparius]
MGKGKVHPSPSPPAAAGGGAGEMMTAEAVLMRLLPAAVLAAAAPLGAEGKEVLAYLVLASLRSSAPPTPARGGDGKAAGEHHRPELGCGCFGCYTAYWSRWDGSPEGDRDAIHRAIEAFDEHLAEEERDRGKGGGGRRGRKKRAGAAAKEAAEEKAGKAKGKGKEKEKEVGVDPLPPLHPPAELPGAPEEAPKAEDGAEYLTAEDEKEEEASTGAAGAEEEKRRRGWGSVLSLKAWGLWGSH